MSIENVELEARELILAAMAGVHRRVLSLQRNGRPRLENQTAVDRWTAEIEGAAAEYAVAKRTGTYWAAVQERPGPVPDAGRYHVRWRSREHYDLPIYRDDPPGPYVLVTGRGPLYVIRGMVDAEEARRDEFWIEDGRVRPAFFYPQGLLRPLP